MRMDVLDMLVGVLDRLKDVLEKRMDALDKLADDWYGPCHVDWHSQIRI